MFRCQNPNFVLCKFLFVSRRLWVSQFLSMLLESGHSDVLIFIFFVFFSGKTLQMVSLIASQREKRELEMYDNLTKKHGVSKSTLVVAPASVMNVWQNEIEKHCRRTVMLSVCLFHGNQVGVKIDTEERYLNRISNVLFLPEGNKMINFFLRIFEFEVFVCKLCHSGTIRLHIRSKKMFSWWISCFSSKI